MLALFLLHYQTFLIVYAKKMVKEYRKKLENIFHNKPEILKMIDNHFNKKDSQVLNKSLQEIEFDASVLANKTEKK